MNYNDLSRRGLIDLNAKYDKENDNALYDFMVEKNKETGFERIRPFEQVADRIDKVNASIRNSNDNIKQKFADRINNLFDSLIDSINEEITEYTEDDDESDEDESDFDEDDD